VKLGEGKHQVAVPEKDWVRVERPELRIVPEPLWKAVQKRKAELFKRYEWTAKGRLQGRPEFSLDKHLLAGFCVCSQCGGRLVVSSARGKRANRYLVCWRHRSSKGLCANKWNVPLQPLTDAIVDHFTKGVLTAEAIAQVVRDLAADADSSPERVAANREALKADLGQVEKRITQAVEALIAAPSSPALAEALKTAEAQKEAIQARLTQIDAVIGKKKKLEIEIANLREGRYPPDMFAQLQLEGLMGDDEEYWPFEGEYWSDEYENYK